MIYIIRTGHEDGGYIKIGYSKSSVENRVRTLQTGTPLPLEIMAVIDGEISDEKAMHVNLDRFRVRQNGEWFYDCAEIRKILGIAPETERSPCSPAIEIDPSKRAIKYAINDMFAYRDYPDFPLSISVSNLAKIKGVEVSDIFSFADSHCSKFFIERTTADYLLSVLGKIIHNEEDGDGEIDFAIPKKTFDLRALQDFATEKLLGHSGI